MPKCWHGKRAFTLVELLIVIGIMMVLAGIGVPVARRISSGNRYTLCQERVAQIGQALKLYRLDEGGFPPHYYDPNTNRMVGLGLHSVYDLDYLRSTRSLSCPTDVRLPDSPAVPGLLYEGEYTQVLPSGKIVAARRAGYIRNDPDASADQPCNTYEYVAGPMIVDASGRLVGPRGAIKDPASGTTDPDFGRQLLTGDASYQPDDTTIVTWCPNHFGTITKGKREDPPGSGSYERKGQYVVLFWDGHVQAKDGFLFRSPNPGEEAWRVLPEQADWDGSGGKLDDEGHLLQQ